MSGDKSRETAEYLRVTVINPDSGKLYDIRTAAEYTSVDADGIRTYWEQGLVRAIDHQANGEPLFDEDAIYWLRRIQGLRAEMRLEGPGLRIVLDLLQEVERLRQELRRA
jgi:DNA-binding transcriptional MerR regulator